MTIMFFGNHRATDLVVVGTTLIMAQVVWTFPLLPSCATLSRPGQDTRLWYRHRPVHEEAPYVGSVNTATSTVLASRTTTTSPSRTTTTTAPSLFPTLRGNSHTKNQEQQQQHDDKASSSCSPNHGINTAMMQDLILGQVALVTMAMTVSLVGDVRGLHDWLPTVQDSMASSTGATILSWWNPPSPIHGRMDYLATSTIFTQGVAMVVAAVLACMAMEQYLVVMDNPTRHAAWRIHFATNNFVVALWGRRGDKRQEHDHNEVASTTLTTDTWTAVLPTLGLAAVTATSQTIVFRYLVPALLWQSSHSVVLAVVGAILLDGLYHSTMSTDNALQKDERTFLMTQQCGQALVYMALVFVCGGNVIPAIMAQTLYLTHVWTTAWHGVNDQIDWAHAAQQQQDKHAQSLSAHDAHVWKALQEHAQGALTADHAHVLQRFFYAFDLDHQGTLSLDNVQMAVAYSFWNQQAPSTHAAPSPSHVQALFRALMEARPSDTTAPPDRITWVEFLRLLVSLRAAKRASL